MVSEVSLFVGLGAGGAEPPNPAGADDTLGGNFAALVARASNDAGAAANGPHPVDGVVNRVFVAEWCLAAPDVGAAATIDGTEGETADTERTTESDEEGSDDALTGMLTGLVAVQPPVVAPPVALPAEPVGPGRAYAETPGAPATPETGVGLAATISQPPSAGTAPTESEGTVAATGADALLGAANDGAEPAEALAAVRGHVFSATRANVLASKREIASSAHDDQREPPVQENISGLSAALSIQGAASAETDIEGLSEVTPRARAAAAQLSKAIERVGGHTTSQPFAVHIDGSQGEAASGEHAPSGSSPEDHAPGTAPARPQVHAPLPAFSSHVVTELQRQPAVFQSSPVTPLPGHEAAPDAGTADQIVQAIRMQFRDGIGDAVIRLKPEHLGEVSVSLRVDQQTVSATVHAEVPAVRQWLESQESMLRHGLSEQGLHLDKFAVREDESGQGQQRDEDADSPRKTPRPLRSNRDEDEPRFEVVV